MTEQESSHYEAGQSPEENSPGLDGLSEALGFVETDELQQLRYELTTAMQAGGSTRKLAARYQELAETLANQEPTELARLGYDVAWALLKREGGRDYVDDLEVAAMHAHQIGLDDVAEALYDELDQVERRDN
jgi:hypothetical protein